MGNGRVIRADDLQYMAAGTGVEHSEFNPSKLEPVHFLQIWIQPDRKSVAPSYAEKSFQEAPTGKLLLAASKSGRDGSIPIHQDADLWLARLKAGDSVQHTLAKGRHAWLHLAEGELSLAGETLQGGDAIAVSGESGLEFTAKKAAQVLLFDLN
jgi:redox-sensitive bicupin YhaK (pirin superfamily)